MPLVVIQPYVGENVVVSQVLWTVTVITVTAFMSADEIRSGSVGLDTLSFNRREECCAQQYIQGVSNPHLHGAGGGLI